MIGLSQQIFSDTDNSEGKTATETKEGEKTLRERRKAG